MSISSTPTYNLKVVIKETGITADTLRAWERRYGLPLPKRSSGGHRLYSQHDIEIVKWLMAKQREGLSISRAVDFWNELSTSGQDPLPAPILKVTSISSENLDAVRDQWLEACLTFNENFAEQVLNQAFALYPLEAVCIEVLQKGLIEIGNLWYQNKATVQQEHFASALAHRRLDALISAAPPPTRPESILIGCTADEQHTFTPLLLALLLRRKGLKVIYLGANVPNQRFQETLISIKPNLIILSAQLLQTANGLRETAENLTVRGARVAYGGRIFNSLPEIRTRIPAHFLGETLQEAIQAIDTLLSSDTPLEDFSPISEQEKYLSDLYSQKQPLITLNTLTETSKIGIPERHALLATQQLGNNLLATLSLGIISALSSELEWTKGLLQEQIQNESNLKKFLEVYTNAIDSVMGKEGQPISTWLRAQTN
jgi:DNA-binding transcriptional MerR regulator/methylmalonyl-CoA mutase cobalamin-binding subunit